MTSLLRYVAVAVTMLGIGTASYAQGPGTTIVNNGNHNINIVVNIQGPTINVPGLPGLPPPPPPPGLGYPGHPVHPGFLPPPPQNTIVNYGHGNQNYIKTRRW